MSLLLIPLALAAVFILESQVVVFLGFSFIFIQSMAGGLFGPLLDDYINKRIPSVNRATVLSIKNMFNSILFIGFSPLIGYCIDLYSLPIALKLMAVILGFISFGFFLLYRRDDPSSGTYNDDFSVII